MKKRLFSILLVMIMGVVLLTGCQKNEENAAVPDLETVYQAVKDAYGENYLPSVAYTSEDLENLFGISADMVAEFKAEGPMMSAHVDQFVAVKSAKGKADEVEQALTDYRQRLLDDTFQYPMNLPKINASTVLRKDDMVFFVMLGAFSESEDEEAALEEAREQVQIGIRAINQAFGEE